MLEALIGHLSGDGCGVGFLQEMEVVEGLELQRNIIRARKEISDLSSLRDSIRVLFPILYRTLHELNASLKPCLWSFV